MLTTRAEDNFTDSKITYIGAYIHGRIVYELSDELVLTSYKKGSEIYYQLNYAYFEQVRNKLIRYIDEIIALGYNEK